MVVIGFIGVGTMGKGMVLNLAKNDFDVIAYNRSKQKVQDIANDRIKAADEVIEVCQADIIMMCLPSDDVVDTTLEKIKTQLAGKILIDCSTTSLELTQKMTQMSKEMEFSFIDAPITGSKLGAENGTLMFMVGGNKKLVDEQMSLFESMGKRIVYCGENTYGQRAKIALNVTQAMLLESYFEGMILAVKNGVSVEAIQEILEHSGARNSAAAFKMPYIKQRDFKQHFMTKLMYKDIQLAEKEIERLGLDLPLSKHIAKVFKDAMDRGYSDDDFCSIIRVLEEKAGVVIK